jgi:hypothetical protein
MIEEREAEGVGYAGILATLQIAAISDVEWITEYGVLKR